MLIIVQRQDSFRMLKKNGRDFPGGPVAKTP